MDCVLGLWGRVGTREAGAAQHLYEVVVAVSGALLCGACQSCRCAVAQYTVPVV